MICSLLSSSISLILTASPSPAWAAPPAWSTLPPTERDGWQRSIGLEAGIAAMHCVQPLAVAAGEIQWKPKHGVAIAGCVLYTGNTVALAYRQKWALWINLIGPVVGITSVFGGWTLHKAGVIDVAVRPDVPQLVGGVLQAWAWGEALRLLIRYGRRGESLLHHRRVGFGVIPTGTGVILVGSW